MYKARKQNNPNSRFLDGSNMDLTTRSVCVVVVAEAVDAAEEPGMAEEDCDVMVDAAEAVYVRMSDELADVDVVVVTV